MGLIKDIQEMDSCFLAGRLDVPLFGTEIEVEIERDPAVDPAYAEKCAEHLVNLSDEMIDELCEKAVRYCNFMRAQWGDFSDIYPDVAEDIDTNIPEDISGRDILRYIFKPVLFISEPEGEGIGYSVEAQCVWEPEHGIDMIIRDDRVLYAASPEGLGAWADDDEYETVFDE